MKHKTDKQKFINERLASAIQLIKHLTYSDKSNISRQCVFSQQDWQMYFELQDKPPESTARMKKALQTYNKIIDSDKLRKG